MPALRKSSTWSSVRMLDLSGLLREFLTEQEFQRGQQDRAQTLKKYSEDQRFTAITVYPSGWFILGTYDS
jgi:hypothetical protein